MSKPSCPLHGTAHVVAVPSGSRYPQHRGAAPSSEPCATTPVLVGRRLQQHRCEAVTRRGETCGRTGLLPPPRLPWHTRLYCMLPERATVERIMCTLVIGFWISALIWVRFVL